MKRIGTVLRSFSHVEYLVQVLNPKDNLTLEDYSLGKFLFFESKQDINKIIGVIYDTELFNPNSLLISRQKEEFATYIPDFVNEIEINLKVLLLGKLNSTGFSDQSIPAEIVEAGSEVFTLDISDIARFHLTDTKQVQIKYLLSLNEFGKKLNPCLFQKISGEIKTAFNSENYSDKCKILDSIEKNLIWEKLFI